ncbi:ROK family protein [Aestuariivirga litoralis]|uniref:ROK family protein n=1 Tax=Aestuariivirga litoralis TaxID=2650924 RepID=UPI001FEF1CFA|nr:ROK family protein [Aestuariivirga litoralis]
MSKQTASEVVKLLCDGGWVRETGRTSGHVGRTATTYELVPESALVVAVDLGGTKLRAAIVDLAGNVLAEQVEPTHPKGGAAVAKQIGALSRAAAESKRLSFDLVKIAVIGCPGVPDQSTGAVRYAPNIAEIGDIDFAAEVSKALGVPCKLENDVNLAVLGEHWVGAGQGNDHLAFISLGTGIGAGLIVNGELLRGAGGFAGELGYLPFGSDPFEPESLRVGAFERVAATHGIRSAYERLTGSEADVPAIFLRLREGDVQAREVIEKTAAYIARAVASISVVANPGLVLLGGSIGVQPELLEATRRYVAQCFPFPVRIEASELGNHAALAGAAAIGLSDLHTALFAKSIPGAAVSLPVPKSALTRKAAE